MIFTKFVDTIVKFNLPNNLLKKNLFAFKTEEQKFCLEISLINKKQEQIINKQNYYKTITTNENNIFLFENGFKVVYTDTKYVDYWYFKTENNNSFACLKLKESARFAADDLLKEEIFDTVKPCVFCVLQKAGKIVLHSASLIYKDTVIPFSANSGVGKSTHTNNWQRLLGVDIFNGDLTLLGIENDKVFAYGIPWCGTSDVFKTNKMPVSAIMFVKRSNKNFVSELNEFDCIINLTMHCFTENLIEEDMNINLDICEQISKRTNIAAINCLADDEAVFIAKQYIDSIIRR